MNDYSDKIKDLLNSDGKENIELGRILLMSQNPDNVFGTICWEMGQPQIEVFMQIKSWDDLDILKGLKLRHRFNSHRGYKCFGIKVSDENFKVLEANLNKDPDAFAEWIVSLKLNYFKI